MTAVQLVMVAQQGRGPDLAYTSQSLGHINAGLCDLQLSLMLLLWEPTAFAAMHQHFSEACQHTRSRVQPLPT
jgi:hypothetical protein